MDGEIKVKGNVPNTYLVIHTNYNKEYSIRGKLKNFIEENYQNKRIKILVRVISKEKGPDYPAEIEVYKIITN